MKINLYVAGFLATLLTPGVALRAQGLLFGPDPMPAVRGAIKEVPLSKDGESWSIPVSDKRISRLIRIAGLGPEKNITSELLCPPSRIIILLNTKWTAASGECTLQFKPEGGHPREDIKLTVEAATLSSSDKIVDPPTYEQRKKAEQNPLKVVLVLQTWSARDRPIPVRYSDKTTPETGTSLGTSFTVMALVFGITLTVVLSGLFIFLKFRKVQPKMATSTENSERQDARQTAPANRVSQDTQIFRQGGLPSMSQLDLPGKDHGILLERIVNLQSELQLLYTRIENVSGTCASMLIENEAEAARRLSDVRNESSRRLSEAENTLTRVERRLSEHLSAQSTKLQDLLKDLPTLAELSLTAPVPDKSALSQLEEQLVSAAKQNVLSDAKLEGLRNQTTDVEDTIRSFLPAAVGLSKEQTQKRFSSILDALEVLNSEVVNLRRLVSSQKHGFFVEMSLLEKSSLGDDLSAALRREVMKLKDPEAYYGKRLAALRAQACVAAIDLADLDLDIERRNLGLQEGLAKLLKAMGMRLIDPRPNDPMQTSEHQVLQFSRRTPGAVPGAIAHTMARGLASGTEVLRKASVLLYD